MASNSYREGCSAVFLDRDGVINQEPPKYAHRKEQLKLIKGVSESIKRLKEKKFKIVVITNQAGVAKGFFKERDIHKFNKFLEKELNRQGAFIDKIYYCPHHPNGIVKKYAYICSCRKPNTGMLLEAQKELNISFKKSFLIGDKKSDIDAGNITGCKTLLVKTGMRIERIKKKED